MVHEEPGDEKGMFRRVLDTVNPFASSSNNKKEDESKKAEAGKEKSSGLPVRDTQTGFFGSLWRGINPFAGEKNTKVATSCCFVH